MPLYEDLPLKSNEFRLLSVSPASEDDDVPVRCHVKVVDLDRVGPENQYYALSYTWSMPADYGGFVTMTSVRNCPVICNGHVVQVSENLYRFLRRVRVMPTLADKAFWIDAICINQDGNETTERVDQIQRMGRIYGSAAKVVTWLGEEDEHTKTAFAILERLADPEFQQIIRFTNANKPDWVAGLLSVVRLFQRTYFTRAWIIQEVVLATRVTVLCGRHEVDWNIIADASHVFSTTGFRDYLNTLDSSSGGRVDFNAPTILRAIGRDRPGEPWTKTLLHTLIRTRNFRCTDLHDKVYSLLGLVQDETERKELLRPGYGGQSVTRTYTNTAIQILENSNDLLLLSCVEGEEFQHPEENESMPSWVPDWRETRSLGLGGTGYKRYDAAGGLTQRPVIDHSALTLTLKGIKLDVITMTGESKHNAVKTRSLSFVSWLRIMASLPTSYHGTGRRTDGRAEHRLEAFWRTLIRNTNDTARMIGENTTLSGSFARWLMATQQHRGACELLSENDKAWLSEAAMQSGAQEQDGHGFKTALAHGKHLRVFRTGSGFLGMGSECLRDGDEVWVVPGSRVPLILRVVGEGGQCRLVGGTYLHGFMKGEAVDLTSANKTSIDNTGLDLEEIIII